VAICLTCCHNLYSQDVSPSAFLRSIHQQINVIRGHTEGGLVFIISSVLSLFTCRSATRIPRHRTDSPKHPGRLTTCRYSAAKPGMVRSLDGRPPGYNDTRFTSGDRLSPGNGGAKSLSSTHRARFSPEPSHGPVPPWLKAFYQYIIETDGENHTWASATSMTWGQGPRIYSFTAGLDDFSYQSSASTIRYARSIRHRELPGYRGRGRPDSVDLLRTVSKSSRGCYRYPASSPDGLYAPGLEQLTLKAGGRIDYNHARIRSGEKPWFPLAAGPATPKPRNLQTRWPLTAATCSTANFTLLVRLTDHANSRSHQGVHCDALLWPHIGNGRQFAEWFAAGLLGVLQARPPTTFAIRACIRSTGHQGRFAA